MYLLIYCVDYCPTVTHHMVLTCIPHWSYQFHLFRLCITVTTTYKNKCDTIVTVYS